MWKWTTVVQCSLCCVRHFTFVFFDEQFALHTSKDFWLVYEFILFCLSILILNQENVMPVLLYNVVYIGSKMHRWVGNCFSVVVKFIVFALFTQCRHYNNINSGLFVTKPITVAFNVYLRDKNNTVVRIRKWRWYYLEQLENN